jgi:hypothetical protein
MTMRTAAFLCAVLALGALCVGCGGSKPEETAVEGAGFTMETAIVIKAKNEKDGYKDQLDWLVKHYPDYQLAKQTLLKEKNQKAYQRVEITVGGGKSLTIYFDITGCYGMDTSGPAHFE